MGVVLPGWADELLDLIGVSWPNVDEDDYREMAAAMGEFSSDIDDGAAEAHRAVQRLVSAGGGGAATEALNMHWSKVKDTHLTNLAEAGRLTAQALDGVAILIEGAKIAALVQLGILAVEIAAAAASAPFTLGLSTLGGLAATQATRQIVKRIFQEVCQQVASQVIDMAMGPVYEALGSMAGDLVVQLGSNAMGARDGVDLGRTAKAGKDGLNEAAGMQLLSATGGGGNGGGGVGGTAGGFRFDPKEYDELDMKLNSVGGGFRDKAGGKISRAKSHHGRTRGKDPIADAANAMLDKVIDGVENAAKTSAKHLDDNMRRGLKQMAKNHRDNDDKVAESFKSLGKNDSKTSSGPNGSGGPSSSVPSSSGAGRDSGKPPSGPRPPGGSSSAPDPGKREWPARDDIPGPAAGKTLMPPHSRHTIQGSAKGEVKEENSVILRGTSMRDIDRDIAAIADGHGTLTADGNRYEVNGRTYGVEPSGRTYPDSGPGIAKLDRHEYAALQQIARAGGDIDKAPQLTRNPRFVNQPAAVQKAIDIYNGKY